MKTHLKSTLACVAMSVLIFSCQKDKKNPTDNTTSIPTDVVNKIAAQGYSTDQIIPVKGGYVVEGDIFLSTNDLNNAQSGLELRVGEEEQYHTTNLITSLPRTITVSVNNLDAIWTAAADSAVARYNALGLRLHFQRVASGGQIVVTGADLGTGGVLGQSSGFPDASGNPPGTITINNHPGTFGSNPSVRLLKCLKMLFIF